jgi:hypothetical protein
MSADAPALVGGGNRTAAGPSPGAAVVVYPATTVRLDPERSPHLAAARDTLHQAAQLVAGAGASLLAPVDDDSHTALRVEGMQLVGHRAALHVVTFVLEAEDRDLALDGRTLAEGERFLSEVFGAPVTRPRHYELPPHPAAEGAPLTAPAREDRAQLAAWYATMQRLLTALAAREPHATPVRLWPHHFDLATLLVLDPDLGSEAGRTVGVGFSPGDAGIDEPYVYVNVHPRPEAPELPALGHGGRWHTEGWLGAVLPGSSIESAEGAEAQIQAFMDAALASGKALLP